MRKLSTSILIVAVVFFFLPNTARAAVTYGASERGDNFGGSPTTVTWNSPNVSGSDVLGTVSITAAGATASISSVTWDGVTMTQVPSTSISANNFLVVHYYIVNPTAGITTVTITGTNLGTLFAPATYFTGVDQTTPVLNGTTNSNAATSGITGTVNLSNNDMYIRDALMNSSACTLPTISVGTKDTQGCDGVVSAGFGYQGPLSSGNQTMVWSDGTLNHTWSGFGINPSVDSVPLKPRLSINGGTLTISSGTLIIQ